MARTDIISRLYAKKGTALEFNYDSLMAPPLASLIPLRDLDYMNRLVTSIKYTSKIDYKESEIKKIMNYYGFVRYASGTHRVVYRHLDIPTIIAKISLNKSSLDDNLREFHNQHYLKPFCTKVFETYPTGLIGLFERVEPFQNREEFMSVAGDIFDFINTKIIGKYVVDDIGTASFMNYGIRKVGPYSNISFGPVILDFPEVYPLDGDKLYCNKVENGYPCGGTLDYDQGFNSIRCCKCGKHYDARELQKAIDNNEVIKKGETKSMRMSIVRDGKVIKTVDSERMGTNSIQPPRKRKQIESDNPMDLIGSATSRRNYKNANTIHLPFEGHNDPDEEKEDNPFCGGYVHVKTEEEKMDEINQNCVPAEEVSEPIETTEEVIATNEEEHTEPVETVEPEAERVYSTETGFIPPAAEELSEPIETTEDTEEVSPEDELGEESSEPVEPEDELGGEAAYIVDPAAIAASMMAGNDDPSETSETKNPFTDN